MKSPEGEPGHSGAHGAFRYRCFLPDLAGFTGLCCTEPGSPSGDFMRFSPPVRYHGGERGIRTPEALFRHLHDFQSCSFGRSDISPHYSQDHADIGKGYKNDDVMTRGPCRVRRKVIRSDVVRRGSGSAGGAGSGHTGLARKKSPRPGPAFFLPAGKHSFHRRVPL